MRFVSRILLAFCAAFCAAPALADPMPIFAYGVYNSSPPTLTSGALGAFQLDSSGNLKVAIGGSGGSTVIGTVSINQATPGTTNGVQVNAALPAGSNTIGNVNQAGVWAVTPTLTTVSTLTLTSSTTAYTSGQLVANNATAGSITNPSFTLPTLGAAIVRLRLQTTDTTSTAWASASFQIDLWSAAPTWTNGDHGTWLPATGSASHIASFSCSMPTAVWGDGLATECTPLQGNYASVTATTVYWSVKATSGSGVLAASKAIKLIAELN